MAETGMNRSALARAAGVDRSTLSQLLAEGEARLPGSQLAAEAAQALGISTDWLLGLTERPERPGDLIAAAVREASAMRASVDERILDWHREARGHKIRHVPATLPDLLKTQGMLTWEYRQFLGKTPEQAVRATMDRIELLRSGLADYEIAAPVQEMAALAAGEGYYRGLDRETRRAQLEAFRDATAEHYPALRLVLFDARRLFSAPITVFGPLLAVIYVGQVYLAFRSEERIRSLTRHFDWLIRECEVDAREMPAYLDGLIRSLDSQGPP